MKIALVSSLCLVVTAGAAAAAVPFLNATCPTGIDVHADANGPVYINGQEAKVQFFNDDYFEARVGHTSVEVSINPDGTGSVSYTGPGGANGICQVSDFEVEGGASAGAGECPVDVTEADRYKYPACN